MLTETGCRTRREQLWSRLPESVTSVVIADPRHVQYFSGFRINPLSFSAEQPALLVLRRSGEATLLADNFAVRSSSAETFVSELISLEWYNHRTSVRDRTEVISSALSDLPLRKQIDSPETLLESDSVPVGVAELLSHAGLRVTADAGVIGVGTVIRTMRRSKHEDELQILRHCMSACDAGHAAAADAIEPGMTELDVYLAVSAAAQQAAGHAAVVYGDFRATNADTPKAGGLPTDYRLRDGDLFILDYSVVCFGYRSDFTNTLPVGTPTAAQIDHAAGCIRSLQAAESQLRAGVPCRDINAAACDQLESAGLPSLVSHCGHGLGLEHPEPPVIVRESDDTLICGDVVTLEPGVYVPGVGGMRFEHNYLITETGAERLSGHQFPPEFDV